jgi:hypothetical protein
MEMIVEISKVMKYSRQPSPIDSYRSNTNGECGIFKIFG